MQLIPPGMRQKKLYQVVAVAVLAAVSLTFIYIFVISPATRRESIVTIAEDKIIEVPPRDYVAISFVVPSRYGLEYAKAQYQEVDSDHGFNAYIADTLGRFECEKHLVAAPGDSAADLGKCLESGTIVVQRVLNATAGQFDTVVGEGRNYLVFENLSSESEISVRYSISLLLD